MLLRMKKELMLLLKPRATIWPTNNGESSMLTKLQKKFPRE